MKLFKVDYLDDYEIYCKSENKFQYFPLWREDKGGLIKKIFVFLIYNVLFIKKFFNFKQLLIINS
ncbi:MAG: hypothetical protein DRJ09_07225 [Bacteroidetes bacterium]|nr:MAG: hypothetical protein DRJ09_07225 [Bacteroidota bacterium]